MYHNTNIRKSIEYHHCLIFYNKSGLINAVSYWGINTGNTVNNVRSSTSRSEKSSISSAIRPTKSRALYGKTMVIYTKPICLQSGCWTTHVLPAAGAKWITTWNRRPYLLTANVFGASRGRMFLTPFISFCFHYIQSQNEMGWWTALEASLSLRLWYSSLLVWWCVIN